jgi:hypothetical protein
MWYVSERERNLFINMKKALNYCHWLHKYHNKSSSLYLASSKYLVDRQELYSNYKRRQGFISAAKKKYVKDRLLLNQQPKLCACGCNQILKNPKNKFINGHNVNLRDKIYKEQLAQKMRKVKAEQYLDYQI